MATTRTYTVNPDLEKERNSASFHTEALTNLLNGGVQQTRRKRYLENLILSDAAFSSPDYHFLSDEEAYSDGLRREMLFVQKLRSHNITDDGDIGIMQGVAFASSTGLSIHRLAFLPAMYSLSTDEQRTKWLPAARKYEILGSYSQTELGHGSFMRGLETTAMYDPTTKQFALNTPTLTSMKWWPGNLARTTNHTLVMAQLYSKGVCYGVHPFLLQIRCLNTHKMMPGVTVGDIGPTHEFKANDNGYMILKDVRIPRENMLMRNGQVLEDGTYVKPANEKLVYASMLNIRAGLTSGSAGLLAKACTIAIRYSCVRRQSELTEGSTEPQVMDFQTQQQKLFPHLATAYAYMFAGQQIGALYAQLMQDITTGNTDSLPQVHALSSGMKSYTTLTMTAGVDECRLACGGHGFSHSSGLPKLHGMAVATAHAEGDATVLYLQLAKYLIKCLADVQKGKTVKNSSADYIETGMKGDTKFIGDGLLTSLQQAYGHRTFRLLRETGMELMQLMSKGVKEGEAFDAVSVKMVDVAKAHCEYFILKTFIAKVHVLKVSGDLVMEQAMHTLCALYAVNGILKSSGQFLQDGYMSSKQLDNLHRTYLLLLKDVRPNAVAYVDAFDFPDAALHSVLGRFDGHVYENLFKWAQQAPLNKTEIHGSYQQYLQPMMKSAKSKL